MYLKKVVVLLLTVLPAFGSVLDNRVDDWDGCALSPALLKEIRGYAPVVGKIIQNIVTEDFKGETWRSLSEFVDRFGPRMSGSQSLEDAIDYMVEEMSKAGLDAYTEEATVTHWKRGFESATMLLPRKANIPILGLGSSVGTMRGGIMGEVVAVESFDEFETIPEETVKGKIVLFAPKWESYGKTVKYRSLGASVASKKGAAAALVRSITPLSLGTLHTGDQDYQEGVRKIPVASVTVEDATRMLRMYRRNETIRIHLEMNDEDLGEVKSRNTIGELKGREKNNPVVVVSGHLDSWDVGVGAMDDGGGAFIAWHAVKFLKAMGLQPRRTIRAILWTGEEQGYLGAKSYRANHSQTEKEEFNFFIESDTGTFTPTGMDFSGNKDAECIFREVLQLLEPLNATQFATPVDGGPDISVWTNRGFPGASLLNKDEKYFWYHHSSADSMLVEDPDALDKCTAVFAAVSYVIADLGIDMPKDVTSL
ncbi:carboxypeptidase Q-like [Phlebotomus argentipes]|uniref:carboxypeptidase Q-like n=1 Tax=Phlebotomus argentipes TaxID=94469 RepID=UPI002892E094|nr:carboxypeptidase Q-like [Phlebotomus argentipes]